VTDVEFVVVLVVEIGVEFVVAFDAAAAVFVVAAANAEVDMEVAVRLVESDAVAADEVN